MDAQLTTLFVLTFTINLIGTLAYAARIAGVRTRRIALAFSLFNALVLISRTANSFQAPLLAKRVESNVLTGATTGILADFRWLLLAASLATIVGALLTPTAQRLFSRGVSALIRRRSLPQLLFAALSPRGLGVFRASIAMPSSANLRTVGRRSGAPVGVLLVNGVATAVWTVGVFASLYAAYLAPDLRATASNLSAVVNGVATILLFVLVDPWLAVHTDDVMEGRASDGQFRRSVASLIASRFAGSVAAQFLLVPAAGLVAAVAKHM
jgi:Alternate to MurJ